MFERVVVFLVQVSTRFAWRAKSIGWTGITFITLRIDNVYTCCIHCKQEKIPRHWKGMVVTSYILCLLARARSSLQILEDSVVELFVSNPITLLYSVQHKIQRNSVDFFVSSQSDSRNSPRHHHIENTASRLRTDTKVFLYDIAGRCTTCFVCQKLYKHRA